MDKEATAVEAYVYAPSADGRRFIGPAIRTVQLGSLIGMFVASQGVTAARLFYRIPPTDVDGQVFNTVWCYANQRTKMLPVDPADPAFRTPESAKLREIGDDEVEVEPPREFSYFLAWID